SEVEESRDETQRPRHGILRLRFAALRMTSYSGGNRPLTRFRNFMHDVVTPEVIDERVACLHGMHDRFRRWGFEQRTQFHEVMACAARVKAVERDDIFFSAIERASISQCH